MATQKIILTDVWLRITDGTDCRYLQSSGNAFCLFIGEAEPSGDADYHTCREAVISAPVKSWCRAMPGTICELVYSDIPVS